MNKILALLLASMGILLLVSISLAMSFGNVWFVLLSIIATLTFIGGSFVLKKKILRKTQE